jgi:methionyl-tRNA formyltransferase
VTGPRAGDTRVRTVFIGSGGFGIPSLRRLASHDDVELVGVVTAPPRPAGRTQRLATTSIHATADELGIQPILTPERLGATDPIAEVLALEPDLVVLADYGQIVPKELLGLRHGALNLHPSLLPRHRGATPIPAAILAGDTETGVTLMRMDRGLDTGPIVSQAPVPLDGTETAPDLERSLAGVAADLLRANVGPWLRGELEARPQDASRATLTRPLSREDGRLDPARTTAELERQVRAYQPWPGSYVDTVVGRLVVWSAEADRGGPGAGRFDAMGLATSDGRLVLREVQPAGGKRMTWADFVRGRPAIIGSSTLGAP